MSLNQNIIDQFDKLVRFIQYEINNSKNIKDETSNKFRLRQIKQILAIIKKYPYQITLNNLEEFGNLQGIGKGTTTRIKEILNDNKLKELDNFNDVANENDELIKELETIVGVGRVTALKFIEDGITSVDDLKNKIDEGTYDVNDKIKLGIKYYGVFEGNIPRKEIDKINKLVDSIIKKMNKKYKYNDDEIYVYEICGSYRREQQTSGDIDILISKLNTNMDDNDNINHLERFIKILKEPIKTNNNEPLLIDDITDKHYETKYMGFAKYKDNPYRRIDIRYVPYDAYFSALLYFTGSATLNVNMRRIAEKMKLKLSEYGLTKENGTKLPIESEYDIFKILKIEYLPPRLR